MNATAEVPFSIDEKKARTIEALRDPRVGDRFHEMLSWWCYVVAVSADEVVTMEAGPPCTFPDDGKVKVQTREEFYRRFTYIYHRDRSWVMLADRDNDVRGWYERPVRTQWFGQPDVGEEA